MTNRARSAEAMGRRLGVITGAGGAGGIGIWNAGAIGPLVNSGTIEGGVGGKGSQAARQATLSIAPASRLDRPHHQQRPDHRQCRDRQSGERHHQWRNGQDFGRWTSGTITIGNGNLTFAGGNTALGDDSPSMAAGTVINKGQLQIATLAPLPSPAISPRPPPACSAWILPATLGRIRGAGGHGSSTLDGRLKIDLTNGFTLAKGDSFDILAFGSLMGGFDALRSTARPAPRRAPTVGLRRRASERSHQRHSLDLFVARGSAVFGPAGSSPIPEASTWAMLTLGFLGLGGLGLSKRKRADEIGLR